MAWFEDAAKSAMPPGSRVAFYLHAAMAHQDGRVLELDRQRNKLTRLCDDCSCMAVIEFSDLGCRDAHRSGLADMIAAATNSERPFDVVLVDSYSVLTRSATELRSILDRLADLGVKVIALSGVSDLKGMVTREMQSIQSRRHSELMRRVWARRKAETAALEAPAPRRKKHKCAACKGRGWMEDVV